MEENNSNTNNMECFYTNQELFCGFLKLKCGFVKLHFGFVEPNFIFTNPHLMIRWSAYYTPQKSSFCGIWANFMICFFFLSNYSMIFLTVQIVIYLDRICLQRTRMKNEFQIGCSSVWFNSLSLLFCCCCCCVDFDKHNSKAFMHLIVATESNHTCIESLCKDTKFYKYEWNVAAFAK